MSAHNIQLFSGAVSIPDDLRVVSLSVVDGIMELGADSAYANVGYVMNNPGGSNAAVYYDKISDQLRVVHTDFGGKEGPNTVTIKNEDITLNVAGNTHSRFYYGDGGLLSNLVSDLQSVTAVEANSDQMIILSNATALWANVGNVLVEGNVTSVTGGFHGDAGWLSNVQIPLEEVIMNGNTTSNIVEFNNALAFVTTGNVGIQNVAPIGDLSIGANVVFDDVGSNVLTVRGNINCEVITIGSLVLGDTGHTEGLQQITDTGNTTTNTVEFNNASTAFKTLKKAGIGIALPSSDAMLHVDGNLRLGGVADTPDNENLFVRAAGALNIIANHSNTDNATSNLVMQAGEINAASITLAGAVTDDDRQRIVFKTRETEALAIDEFGNANFVSNVVVGTGAKFIGDIRTNSMEIDDYIYHVGDTNTYFGFPSAYTFGVTTGNTEQLRIDSSGVQGVAFASLGDTNTMMRFPSADTIAWNTGGAERMRINNTGVGIGTTSAGAPLQVQGNQYILGPEDAYGGVGQLYIRETTTNNGELRIGVNRAYAFIDTTQNQPLIFNSNYGNNVGINQRIPTERLHVDGNILASGNITAYSDKRIKSDITKIENALDKIEKLNGYTFTVKDKRYTGLIAQEVIPVLPEAVTGSEETQYGLAYGNMIGLVVEAIKEMREEIKSIKSRL